MIPEDWVVKRLGDTAILKARIGWQGLTTAEYLNSGDFYLITGTDFQDGYINWGTCHYVDEFRYKQDRNIQLKESDVLVTKDGTIGKVAIVKNLDKPGTLNSGVFVIRPIENAFLPEFFYYQLCSNVFSDFLSQLSAGSTINHLYQKDFVNYRYKIPPTLAEQTAIAEVLSDADALIESLEQLIAKKRLVKQGAMQELLTGKRRLPGFGGEWVLEHLRNVAEFYKGKGLSKDDLDPFGDESCIHYGELFTRYPETIREIISRTSNRGHWFRSVRNDVLMPTSDVTPRGLAKASCITTDGVILGADILVIRLDVDKVFGLFLAFAIRCDPRQVLQLVTGTTVFHLYASDMKKFAFFLPPVEEQQAIVVALSDLDSELIALESKLTKARALKQGMMQELLTGRTRLI